MTIVLVRKQLYFLQVLKSSIIIQLALYHDLTLNIFIEAKKENFKKNKHKKRFRAMVTNVVLKWRVRVLSGGTV